MALACLGGAEGCPGGGGGLRCWHGCKVDFVVACGHDPRRVLRRLLSSREEAATDAAEAATRAALLRGWPFHELGEGLSGSRWPSSSTPYSKKSRKWTTEKWRKRCDLCWTSREGPLPEDLREHARLSLCPLQWDRRPRRAPIFRAPGAPTLRRFAALTARQVTRSALCAQVALRAEKAPFRPGLRTVTHTLR